MRFHWFALVIVLCAIPLVSPAGEKADNPLKNAKIGDYVVYKMITTSDGKDTERSVKHTVSAKNEKEVTLHIVAAGKMVKAENDAKIDLTKPFDPITNDFTTGSGKWEKTGAGNEKIKVGDKTYDCTWVTAKSEDGREIKIWSAKSAPLTGLVKWEVKVTGGKHRVEITGSGSAK